MMVGPAGKRWWRKERKQPNTPLKPPITADRVSKCDNLCVSNQDVLAGIIKRAETKTTPMVCREVTMQNASKAESKNWIQSSGKPIERAKVGSNPEIIISLFKPTKVRKTQSKQNTTGKRSAWDKPTKDPNK